MHGDLESIDTYMRKYFVSNDTVSAVSKSNKCETYQQKITNSQTIEKHVLVGNYFLHHVSCLLEFDMDDMVDMPPTMDTHSRAERDYKSAHIYLVYSLFFLIRKFSTKKGSSVD